MGKIPQIDAAMVRRIADLAHLSLTEEEVAFYQQSLKKIIGHMSDLASIEFSNTPKKNEDIGTLSSERLDEVRPSLSAEKAVSQSQVAAGTSFRVPRVVE